MILVVCPDCSSELHAPEETVGRYGLCPNVACGRRLYIAQAPPPTITTAKPTHWYLTIGIALGTLVFGYLIGRLENGGESSSQEIASADEISAIDWQEDYIGDDFILRMTHAEMGYIPGWRNTEKTQSNRVLIAFHFEFMNTNPRQTLSVMNPGRNFQNQLRVTEDEVQLLKRPVLDDFHSYGEISAFAKIPAGQTSTHVELFHLHSEQAQDLIIEIDLSRFKVGNQLVAGVIAFRLPVNAIKALEEDVMANNG